MDYNTWTLPANRAVAISKDIDYSLVQVDKNYLIIAKKLVASVMEKSGISEFRIIEDSMNSEMNNVLLEHPFYDIKVPLIFAEHVTDENGTGAVHIAPGHGTEDYVAGLEHDLEVFSPVDDYGRFKESLPIFRA